MNQKVHKRHEHFMKEDTQVVHKTQKDVQNHQPLGNCTLKPHQLSLQSHQNNYSLKIGTVSKADQDVEELDPSYVGGDGNKQWHRIPSDLADSPKIKHETTIVIVHLRINSEGKTKNISHSRQNLRTTQMPFNSEWLNKL